MTIENYAYEKKVLFLLWCGTVFFFYYLFCPKINQPIVYLQKIITPKKKKKKTYKENKNIVLTHKL